MIRTRTQIELDAEIIRVSPEMVAAHDLQPTKEQLRAYILRLLELSSAK